MFRTRLAACLTPAQPQGGGHPLLDGAWLLAAAVGAAVRGQSLAPNGTVNDPSQPTAPADSPSHTAAAPSLSPTSSVLRRDFAHARLLTLNKPQALNATDLGMQCLLRRYLIEQRHPQDAGSPVWDRERQAAAAAAGGSHQTGLRGGGLGQREVAAPHSAASPDLEDVSVAAAVGAAVHHHQEGKKGCVYVLRGAGGRSFCAGGDVVAMIKEEPVGTQFAASYLEYQLNYYLWSTTHRMAPDADPGGDDGNVFVALWDGYVMGGGAGLSVHGHYRVAAPNSVFSMPECTIGFFPDVGASYFLPRLDIPSEYNSHVGALGADAGKRCRGRGYPGLGLYLALTGARLTGADLVHCGLATHFLADAARFPALTDALCQARGPADVEAVLDAFCVPQAAILSCAAAPAAAVGGSRAAASDYAFSLAPEHLAVIAECFTLHPEAVARYNATRTRSNVSKGSDGVDEAAPAQPRRRKRLGGPIEAVDSVEDVVSRLQAVYTRETSTSVNLNGNKKAADFARRLLQQLWPALTGEPHVPSLRQVKETDADEDEELAATPSREGSQRNGAKKAAERPPPPVSPTSLKLTFDMQRRSIEEADLAPALAREYAACVHACGPEPYRAHRITEDEEKEEEGRTGSRHSHAGARKSQQLPGSEPMATATSPTAARARCAPLSRHHLHLDFVEGVDALLIRKGKTPPTWHPATLAEVHQEDIDAFYIPRTRHGFRQPVWDPYTPFEAHRLA